MPAVRRGVLTHEKCLLAGVAGVSVAALGGGGYAGYVVSFRLVGCGS